MCIKENCNIRPTFNKPGEKKALYCASCADPDMVDVKNKMCAKENCNTRANYGYPGNIPTACSKHILHNMIISPRKKCEYKNCKEFAIYGNKEHIYCDDHKKETHICFLHTKCAECGEIDILIDNLCVYTCSPTKQAEKLKKYTKKKELRIYNLLIEKYKQPSEYNKKVSYDCGGKNSEEKEFGYDNGTHKLFIEVDENQHKHGYCEEGEIKRMRNIYMNEGGIPIIFLRYNPDNYYIKKVKQITPQTKKEDILLKWIKHYENINNINKPLSVHYLYYDNIDPNKNHEINVYKDKHFNCDNCNKIFFIKSLYKEHKSNCNIQQSIRL
jgi:hypothetical protein